MNITYRIREFNGYFNIEILICKKTVFLWWKKSVYKWCNTDVFGNYRYFQSPFDPSPYFRSLKEAKEQINIWKKRDEEKTKYHYINEIEVTAEEYDNETQTFKTL